MSVKPAPQAWEGTRPFRVESKTAEAAGVASLVLVPEDGKRPPPFLPGQSLTLEFVVAGRELVRCFSISSPPGERGYRITVKAGAPPSASAWLVHEAAVGDRVLARAPAGAFTFDPLAADPVVLVAGGIGITPFASMLAAHRRAGSRRRVHLFFGARDGATAPLQRELERRDSVAVHVLYSRPRPEDVPGRDYERAGRITVALLQELVLPDERPYDFYLCGPPAFLHDLSLGLAGLGVPESKVHVELFGPTAVREVARATRRVRRGPEVQVEFARSRKKAAWDPSLGALLDLAERQGVPIPYACAAGRCGTCLTKLARGEVEYPVPPGFGALGPGYCLPCVARPRTDVVLDA